MVKYDAELRNWWKHRINGFRVIVGNIFGDRKRRWPDGRVIHTSVLLTERVREGTVVRTMNSNYLLVGPENVEAEMLIPESRVADWEGTLGGSHSIEIDPTQHDALRRQLALDLRAAPMPWDGQKMPS